MQIEAQYLTPERKRRCDLLFDAVGVHFRFGRKIISYSWAEVRRLSFDDPGRTKANVGAIAVFGVLGLASRQSFTLISISTSTEELSSSTINRLQCGAVGPDGLQSRTRRLRAIAFSSTG